MKELRAAMSINKDSNSIDFMFRHLKHSGTAKLNRHCIESIDITRLSDKTYSISINLGKAFVYSNQTSYKCDKSITIYKHMHSVHSF